MKKGLATGVAITGGIGIVSSVAGYMFKIMHWPGAFYLRITGGILLMMGALLIIVSLVKNRA